MAGKLDLTIRRGVTFSKALTWYSDAAGTNAVDLTGYTARMKIRKKTGSPPELLLTTENGRISLGGVAGTIDLTISATDTQGLPPGDYRYDLFLESAANEVTNLVEGKVVCLKTISEA